MATINVHLHGARPVVICAPEDDRFYLQFQTAGTMQTGEPYTVALTIQSGLELLALLEQARKHNALPLLTAVGEPLVVPPDHERH